MIENRTAIAIGGGERVDYQAMAVPNVKSSSFYRTTNATTLVKQIKEKRRAGDGYCTGSWNQL